MILIVFFALVSGFGPAEASPPEVPDLSGPWALYQVITEHWDVPLLGERLRRVVQVAKIRVEQRGEALTLWSEEVCSMLFDLGTALVRISVAPEFVRSVRVGPLPARLERDADGFLFLVPPYLVLNGVWLEDPQEPLPIGPDDPRVLDPDGDGKPGFTVRITVLGFLSGESYVVQRLRQEYRGRVLGADLIRGSVLWHDEQVTLGASSSFFLVSGKGRPAPELAFFVLRRLQGGESCAEILELFAEELGP